MKLSEFLEKIKQGAETTFDENARTKIDSFLYAKLPPKLKRSINMACPENATDEEIFTHIGDDSTVPTMSTAPTATRPEQGLLSSGVDPGITSKFCKKPSHTNELCKKLKRKEEDT